MTKVNLDEKPPSSICQPTSVGVRSSSRNGNDARRREVVLLQHLPSPMLASRLRNDLVVLETFR